MRSRVGGWLATLQYHAAAISIVMVLVATAISIIYAFDITNR